jgi:hypothetical protein
MLIDRDDRAVFTDQLVSRRRGRPRSVRPVVITTVRVPEPIFDAYCQMAHARGESVSMMMRAALSAYAKRTA